MLLDIDALDAASVVGTLHVLLKNRADIDRAARQLSTQTLPGD
jgi:hypothetical protein